MNKINVPVVSKPWKQFFVFRETSPFLFNLSSLFIYFPTTFPPTLSHLPIPIISYSMLPTLTVGPSTDTIIVLIAA